MGFLFDTLLMDLLVFVAASAGALYWFFTRNFDYWEKRGVPYLKPVPFFGNMQDLVLMRRSQGLINLDQYNQLDGHKYGGLFQFSSPALMIRDPDLIRNVLVKDFHHFQDRGLKLNPKLNPLTQHLLRLSGATWKGLRAKLSPTFTSGKMKMMFHAVEECGRNLQKFLQEQADNEAIVELKEVLARFSTDVIGTCAFGLQMNALDSEESEFRKMGRRIFNGSPKTLLRIVMNIFLPTLASLTGIGELETDLVEFFMKAVKETVEYREKNNVKRNDFLQLLIDVKNERKLEEDEVDESIELIKKSGDIADIKMDDGLFAAQAFVFFVAGFETSSTTMSFALHELAVNPDVQTRLREEIDAALQATGGRVTYDALIGMKYLDKVVCETLRKYPPVSSLVREVTVPYDVPGADLKLEKGLKINIPVYALQHDPQHYPDPDRFDPERFSEENKAKRHNYAFLPFGEGPRNCIGMRFGLLQTKMGIVSLLSKFEFHVCERTELPIRLNPRALVLASTTGTILRVTNRR